MDRSLRVLIAEDEYLILMGLKSNLQQLGHTVIAEALDGKQAVAQALEVQPDLIIMDINLPSIDGIEAIKQICCVNPIPSIIVTGYNDKELVARATQAGVFGYLVKPVDVKELQPAISIALARYQEYTQLRQELNSTQKALEARKTIERAKGVVMDRLNLQEQEAMEWLQRKSNNTNRKLLTVAEQVIKASEYLKPAD